MSPSRRYVITSEARHGLTGIVTGGGGEKLLTTAAVTAVTAVAK